MEQQVQKILEEKVNPILEAHLGGAALVRLDDNVAVVRMMGTCATCPSAIHTVEEIVKGIICEHCEGIEDVMLDTSVSDDLLDMAKKILNKEI